MRSLQRCFPSTLFYLPSKEPIVYLTFDDGPHPSVTQEILQILDSYNAKATFFVVGENVGRYPEVMVAIRQRGHAIGNHTYSHLHGWKSSKSYYLKDVAKAEVSIDSSDPSLFRPPYGKMKFNQWSALKKQVKIVLWDVLSKDYCSRITPDQCVQRVLTSVKPGSIVVFHDSQKAANNVLIALPQILKALAAKGYVFKAIS